MAKILIATVKPFSAEAVAEVKGVLEDAKHEVKVLEKYPDQAALIKAVADADAMKMTEGETAKGLQMKIDAYGDPVAYNMKELADKLAPDVKINIIHTGEGTLWTDLEKANAGELGGAVILKQNQKK